MGKRWFGPPLIRRPPQRSRAQFADVWASSSWSEPISSSELITSQQNRRQVAGPICGRSGIILWEQAVYQEFSEEQAAGLQACRGTGCEGSSRRSRRQIPGPILREKEVSERTVTGLRV
ncbi:hypothetical protein NDU88_002935 [Pleurodeles waltl]|uniref:Uncharacterized protein n=1 Tax=Pleurodeles waltl TaxID=8319 RepID=A0AAV7TPI8_PLEWA|nr:hypothetical protein NDU88_002935 [Pleurodeles waltl]